LLATTQADSRLNHNYRSSSIIDAPASAIVRHPAARCEPPGRNSFGRQQAKGGNRPRALARRPQVLIINQPTRGVDVGAAEYIRQRLMEERTNGAAILMVSADLDEILALSDRIAVMYEGSLLPVEINLKALVMDKSNYQAYELPMEQRTCPTLQSVTTQNR
jgi:ABC-type glutathione transport system ATPase component